MAPVEKALVADMIDVGKRALQKHLIWGSSGNLSQRLDHNRFIITESGASLGELDDDEFAIVELDSGKSKPGADASMETLMHTAFYRTNSNVNSVFHSQAFFTTLVSCTDLHVNEKLFPESMAYLDRVGRAPYQHPGSFELAEAVEKLSGECDCIILSNHGAICGAENLDEVLLKTETLELLCRLVAVANIEHIELNYLPQKLKAAFLDHLKDIRGTDRGSFRGG